MSKARSNVWKLRPIINVQDPEYGAKGDGVTDDSAAIKAAVNAAAALTLGAYQNRASVYFPPGVYLIGTSAVLTESNTTSIRGGIDFHGDGADTSVLRLNPGLTDMYFYDNVSTPRMQFCTFHDLGFEGRDQATFAAYTDISTHAKGFRLRATTATGSHEQGFQFTRCRFQMLDTVLETAGDNTTSENFFVQCRIFHIRTAVMKINNGQSFNHEFHACNVAAIYGDCFQMGASGGGAIKVVGGSWIMFSDTGVDTFFFNATGAGGSGINTYPIITRDVRFELRGNTANLVKIPTLINWVVDFENCNFLDTGTASKASWVTIGSQSAVYFRRCAFAEQAGDYIKFAIAGTAGAYGLQGEIEFDTCELGTDWSDKCSITTTFGGSRISAINCFGKNIGAILNNEHFAHDFDLYYSEANPGQFQTWVGSGATLTDVASVTHPQARLKTAHLKMTTEYWPNSGGAMEHTLKLPKNAIIRNIHLYKPAGGTDATPSCIVKVGRNDKSGTPHCMTNAARFRDLHQGEARDLFYHVGTTENERKLRMWMDEVPSQFIQGGIAIVEYH